MTHECTFNHKDLDAKLAEHNTRLVMNIGFDRKNSRLYATPSLSVEKINKRKREIVSVMPTFCPWCGAQMLTDDEPVEHAAATS